ncbi:hypothetical protein EV146_104207 [Mesobacillus foraminis]|uniref:Uncharacterized protein n=1 Tax=Mesobacillus foraminis TaxID=279826 RepID=A0A4V2RDT9_9BACI|nr:hypothetical protein EV146_104207 [Mesobacillus foraminis]
MAQLSNLPKPRTTHAKPSIGKAILCMGQIFTIAH